MRVRTILAVLCSLPIFLVVTAQSTAVPASASFPLRPKSPCPVTLPMDEVPPGSNKPSEPMYYGNEALWTVLWRQGRIVFEPGGPGFVLPDGSLGMKWGWVPLVPGDLTIEGRRLDGPAAPLQSDIGGMARTESGQGFYPTYLIFPTPGCWQVTGRVGDATLTFVTLVVKVGDGPNWRPETVP
jgi:hypothetical protein